MTVTVTFSSFYRKVALKVTLHYDVYCDFLECGGKDCFKSHGNLNQHLFNF